ncbi:DUF2798 domain-containing protein [Shewanella maritima]|nr:DUF2798 domain-containing protein [Shewanella maritima]
MSELMHDTNLSNSQQSPTPLWLKVLLVTSLMSTIAGTLTGVMTYMNLGFSELFFSQWLSSFLFAATTAMPAGFVFMTLFTKLIKYLTPNLKAVMQNLIVGLLMAITMEALLAFITTTNNLGLSNSAFFTTWFDAFIVALPVGLVIMLVVSNTVKPKIERILTS